MVFALTRQHIKARFSVECRTRFKFVFTDS